MYETLVLKFQFQVKFIIPSILLTADTVYDIEVFLNDSYDETKGSMGFISVTVNRDTSEPIFDKTITLYDTDNLEVHKNLLVEICEKLIQFNEKGEVK